MPHSKPRPVHNHVKSDLLRWILICIGWISIVIGIIALFLPLVPTVPFLLLAAVCFSKSSEKFHSWLLEHRHLGPPIRDYLIHGGVPLRTKILAIGMVWISFPASAFLFVQVLWLKVLLLTIATAVTLYLLTLPTVLPVGKGEEASQEPVDPSP